MTRAVGKLHGSAPRDATHVSTVVEGSERVRTTLGPLLSFLQSVPAFEVRGLQTKKSALEIFFEIKKGPHTTKEPMRSSTAESRQLNYIRRSIRVSTGHFLSCS